MSDWNFSSNSDKKKLEFTKFPEGVTRIRLLSQAPKMAWTHWIMKDKRSIICPGHSCPICQIRKTQKENKQPQTYSVARRLRIYVFNYETNRIEIMEQGVTFFEELLDLKKDLEKEGKILGNAIFKVKRKGTSKETTGYRIDFDSYEPVDLDSEQFSLKDYPVLEEMFQPHTPEQILQIVEGKSWDEVFGRNEEDEEKETIVVE